MKMPWRRFLLLDGLGIVLIVPLLTLLGYHSQAFIDDVIGNVQRVERGLLFGILGGAAVVAIWFWLWRRRQRSARRRATGEAFVQPSRPVAHETEDDPAPPAKGPG
jgi:membrane protein DedA with SNARE-associated domain